jgi:branched-chain amino acid aminotransferase
MADHHGSVPENVQDVYVNVNGELVPGDEPHISAVDRGLLYGDDVFDSFPVYDSKAILFDRHLDRLYRSIKGARIDVPIPKGEMRQRVAETLEASELKNGGCRIIVTRGVGSGIRNASELDEPTVIVIPVNLPADDINYAKSEPIEVTARIASTRTVPPDVVDPTIKDGNYLNNALAERELVGTGDDIAIMLNHQGTVSEAFDSNVFALHEDGTYRTPPRTHALEGISRAVAMEQAEKLGYDVEVAEVTPGELFSSEDVLLVGSDRGVSTVVELNGQTIGDSAASPQTHELLKEFHNYVTTEEYLELDI